LLSRRRRKVSG